MNESVIEQLLAKQYFVLDFLPYRVPSDGSGRFFTVENYILHSPYEQELRRKYLNIIIKLNCYHSITVYDCTTEKEIISPDPDRLSELIAANDRLLYILVDNEEALVSIDRNDTHITVYSSSDGIKQLIALLAQSEGLFVWEP